MAASEKYLRARTPFGVIVSVEDRLFSPEVVVKHRDGSSSTHLLHRLIVLGLTLATPEPQNGAAA